MPETRPPAKRRASRRRVRAWAWLLGTCSFLTPWVILGMSPKPAADAAPARVPKKPAPPQRPVVLVITKKIIETTAAPSGPARTTSGAAPINYVYAPAPASAPVTVSCGTHPC